MGSDDQQFLDERLRARTEQLAKLHEVSELIHGTRDLDGILRLILVALTAGEGFRFNRAFLLLLDERGRILEGRLAVGPSNKEEAGRIWSNMPYLPGRHSLRDTLQVYEAAVGKGDVAVNRIVRELRIPVDDSASAIVASLKVRGPCRIEDGSSLSSVDRKIMKRLGVHALAAVPLLVGEAPVGCLLVDNAITGRPIQNIDLEPLDIFANHAALAIENASMQAELARKVRELEQVCREKDESQKRLVEAEKLAALGRMAATVAHEIRTPLVSIGGFARSILKQMPGENETTEDLRIIRDEVARLEDVIERLLFYARPREPQKQPGDLNRCIESLIAYLARDLAESHVRVSLDLARDVPEIHFDDRQLRQVFLNLFSNAVQAMPDGGQLGVQSRMVGDEIQIDVSDTGVGISRDSLKQIFKPFYTTRPKGTGLGLHISQLIVEKHGGGIDVASVKDMGTTFTVRLPCADRERSGQP